MIYSLYSAADGSVSVDIREKDTIEAIEIDTYTLVPVDGAVSKAELSFGSASQFTTNDATNVLASIFNASDSSVGVGKPQVTKFLTGLNIPINAGERLYLHALKGSQTDQVVRAFVYTRKAPGSTASRR